MRFLVRALVVLVAVAVLAVGALVVAGVLRSWRIPSSSMEPTLHCGRPSPLCGAGAADHVVSLRYVGRDPERGDVVAFHTPPAARVRCGSSGVFVKRVVALPGERWAERKGRVLVNGRPLAEPYVDASRRDTRTFAPVRLAPDRYFLLGDNRIASCDSRVWGPVARSAIIGKVVLRYWPLDRLGAP